ncbi:hypothetical protein AAMO2058_001001800 [Amorphochlora amoebiformis]
MRSVAGVWRWPQLGNIGFHTNFRRNFAKGKKRRGVGAWKPRVRSKPKKRRGRAKTRVKLSLKKEAGEGTKGEGGVGVGGEGEGKKKSSKARVVDSVLSLVDGHFGKHSSKNATTIRPTKKQKSVLRRILKNSVNEIGVSEKALVGLKQRRDSKSKKLFRRLAHAVDNCISNLTDDQQKEIEALGREKKSDLEPYIFETDLQAYEALNPLENSAENSRNILDSELKSRNKILADMFEEFLGKETDMEKNGFGYWEGGGDKDISKTKRPLTPKISAQERQESIQALQELFTHHPEQFLKVLKARGLPGKFKEEGRNIPDYFNLFLRESSRTLPLRAILMLHKDNNLDPQIRSRALMELSAEEFIFYLEEKPPPQAIIDYAKNMSDLTNPHNWYSLARSISPRKVIIHAGPTNSGKTYAAMEALRQGKSGVYLSPLRLLAQEGYDKLSSKGVLCDLKTGQEMIQHEGATHLSCTVECLNPTKRIEAAVIDEMQNIADPERGWAWSAAFLGVAADEVHVCGDRSMVLIVQQLASECEDIVEVRWYQRKLPLSLTEIVSDWSQLRKGDAVITFTSSSLYSIKKEIESQTKLRCAMVYGSFPPKVRKLQAKWFNKLEDCDILVATDAVGMGLNLNIGRIIFSTTRKFDGKRERNITTSEILQIAGRAGRFGTRFEHGYVTCTNEEDFKYIREKWEEPLSDIPRAGIRVTHDLVMRTHEAYPQKTLTEVLKFLEDHRKIDPKYFLVDLTRYHKLAKYIQKIPVIWKDRLAIVFNATDSNSESDIILIRQFAWMCTRNRATLPKNLIKGEELNRRRAPDRKFTDRLINQCKLLDLYLSLSTVIGKGVFVDTDVAIELRDETSDAIDKQLKSATTDVLQNYQSFE